MRIYQIGRYDVADHYFSKENWWEKYFYLGDSPKLVFSRNNFFEIFLRAINGFLVVYLLTSANITMPKVIVVGLATPLTLLLKKILEYDNNSTLFFVYFD